jgi:hypothetical protein
MATVAHSALRQQPARRSNAAGRSRPQDRMPPATTPEVDAIGALPFTGNLIPHAWYTALTLPSGKPDLVAITLLADIVYW